MGLVAFLSFMLIAQATSFHYGIPGPKDLPSDSLKVYPTLVIAPADGSLNSVPKTYYFSGMGTTRLAEHTWGSMSYAECQEVLATGTERYSYDTQSNVFNETIHADGSGSWWLDVQGLRTYFEDQCE